MNVNFLIVSWRGFSGNDGQPSEKNLYIDANSTIKWLDVKCVKKNQMVLYGESLGTGIAVEVASKSKRGLLKTFAKLQDAYVAEDDFWKIINWSLEWNRYSGIAKNLGLNQDNILKVLDSD